RIAGERFGLLAGLYVALPPIFLSYVQLSSHGENVALTFGTVVLAAGTALLDGRTTSRARAVAWAILGLAGGLGWWGTQMMGMFLVAAALALVVARPRVLREPGPYVALGLFALAGLPFWVWNVQHEWSTFWHLLTWGDNGSPELSTRIGNVAGALVATLRDYYWDGHAVKLPAPVSRVGAAVVVLVYLPAVLLAAGHVGTWAWRLWRRQRPWQEPLDLVVLAFWLTVAAHLATWFGTSGVLRYSMTFYATLPVLCAVLLARVARLGRLGGAVAVALALLLLGYDALTHVYFVRDAEGMPRRPVDAAIARLEALGIRACYADSRIAQVIAFESRERVVCADYEGYRNFAFLQAVDAVEDPGAVAIVTHRVLRGPEPDAMAQSLRLLGAEVEREEVGEYVIFHHARPPDPRIRPIPPTRWSARTSWEADAARFAFDRQIWTRWTARKAGPEWFELDLGAVHRLAQVTLATGPFPGDAPVGLRVETSPDGRVWDIAGEAPDLVSGLHWWKGHPRVDGGGRVIVRMVPRPARYVRFTQTGRDRPGVLWSLSELFAYEIADAAWEPPPAARAAYREAQAEVARWMDDPGGPHPKRAPVTYEHRRAQVRWAAAFAAADRALAQVPEWEDAYHLYARILDLSGWSGVPEVALAQARADGAWPEVLRWVDLAGVYTPGFWRSGWGEARVEALARLGRDAETEAARAAASRAEADRRPARPIQVRFGSVLEFTGADFPAAVHPGERVVVRYSWRVLDRMRGDYTAFVHLHGPGRRFGHDHRMGADYGTSRWAAGERTQETLTLRIPPDAPPGPYSVTVGVWLAWSGKKLRVTEADVPYKRYEASVATLRVVPSR
ncbi:MAG TPA: discoidin domain-containing protein, partial [Methylomirabilota bacterium]|nr:discoidin domain-containing protein [Methylomirabilota bacterium]